MSDEAVNAETEAKPWEKMDGEPDYWFNMFQQYLLQGPRRRSIAGLENQQRIERGEAPSRAVSRTWRKYSKDWKWRERAAAWDEFMSKKVTTDIDKAWSEKIMKATEVLGRLSEMGRANIYDFIKLSPDGQIIGFNEEMLKQHGYLVKKISTTRGRTESLAIELHGAQTALETVGKHLHLFDEKREDATSSEPETIVMPADAIAPGFLNVFRDIKNANHVEYVFHGGRGSTKSSFVSLVFVYLLVNNPTIHGLAVRKVANTLRDSVYAQIVWAIGELGLDDKFKCNVSPLEITYRPTGQKIYFRGADDPGKIKSIKPPFGYIGELWFEELDQFAGEEEIRKIEQSAIRGGEIAYIFKSFNPPRTAANWANRYCKTPKANQLQHASTYLDVPKEWLGKTFLEEAEHLKEVNPGAYEHEYLGIANGTGGLVFENVVLREITDDEIANFDRIHYGLDFGYFPDPLAWVKVHYDAARLTLYIFDEFRAKKMSNRELYDYLVGTKGMKPSDDLIADSAEPKSIADLREYGLSCRGAEKGPESVTYSMKWLQSLKAIVIDPRRAPETAEEFLAYELEMDKEGNFISAYPDKNNHSIDAVRYAMNNEWRRRGK